VRRSRLARGRRELLVQWKGQPAAEATWTDLEEFQKLYPEFQLEDELLAAGGMSWSVCSTPGGRARSRARENATAAATDQGAWRHSVRVSSQFVRHRNP
jgi:hypothetical protein